MVILNISNIRNENIIIKGIRSDLFQAAIFVPKGKEIPHSYNQKNLYPKILAPEENFSLQVIILPDMVGKTLGNIYFELADNKIIVFPVEIKAVENIYKISPIYVHNWQGSKLFISQINLYNPHPKTLIIKEVINSFSSINLIWPNGQPVSSNHTSISSSMLEVPAKSTKNILQINFYKDVPGVEYGLLQLKTDRDTLIIPVVVGVEVQVIKFFPNFYNFGVIDVNRPIKRLIPISLSNLGLAPIQIKSIYSSFDENLIEFIPNLNNFFCNFDLILSGLNLNSFSFDNGSTKNLISPQNPNSYSPNICIINRIENMNNFGFLMIDPENFQEKLNSKQINKKTRGSIIIQTNFTDNPFIELVYEYYLDKNTLSFDKEPELYYNNFKNTQVNFNIRALIKAPFSSPPKDNVKNNSDDNNSNNQLVININSDKNKNNQDTRELLVNLKINNIQTFQNKKNYFLPIKLNNNMLTIFPIKLFDRSLELHYCDYIQIYKECLAENYSAYKSVNFKSQTINIDFGLISASEAGKKYFNLINDNGENIKIKKLESNSQFISFAIESIEDIHTNKKVANKFNKNFEIGKSISIFKKNSEKDLVSLIIPKESYLTISIVVNSTIEQELNASVFIHFENNIKLTINVNSKFLRGSLNITPSIVRFEPAFPGLFQSKLVSSKSSYNIPINIHSIKSFDQRIIPVILTNSIISNNRTEILKIIFDPSKVEIEENFMRGDSFTNFTSRHLTYKELYLWKEKQKLWEILGSQGRTEINSVVKIKTNIQTETVNVRGFLTKPSLVKKDEVEFGLVQLGESNTTYIEVFNPSDEPMSIQILLAPEEYADIHNNSMFITNKQRLFPLNNITILDCNFFNISNFIDQTSQNFTQNFINNRSKKKKKKNEENHNDNNLNSILIEEDISHTDLNNRKLNKIELLKKIFLYTNVNSKMNFMESERIICNTNFFKKNEIIFNNNKELMEKIFSEEFMKEINIVRRMTDRNPPSQHKVINRESHLNMFERLAQTLKIFFKTETPPRKKRIEEVNPTKQEFYLPKSLSSQLFIIKPHQKTKIGPIVYSPSNHSINSTATLFIKNNLTVLYPIKLKGYGGSGVINFFLVDTNLTNGKIQTREEKIERLIINIVSLDEIETQNNNIKKVIKIKNTGNLPVKVNNISVKDSGCEGYGIRLSRCDGFSLNPDENLKLTVNITPDFNFYYLEKEIIFETQHHTISIKILITISNDILSSKNRLFNFEIFRTYGIISFSGSIFIIFLIFFILKNETKVSKKINKTLCFVTTKDIIEKDSTLKFENLFIKTYRKNNRTFYEEFFAKHMDAPTKHEVENLISDKKKKLNKNESRATREPEFNQNNERNNNVKAEEKTIIKENEKEIRQILENPTNELNSNKELVSNVNINKNSLTTKKTTEKPKKENISIKKSINTKKPIGISVKTTEKKEEDKKGIQIINPNTASTPITNSLLPNSIYQPNNKYDPTTNFNQNKSGKEEINPPPEYFNNQVNPNWDPSYFPQMGFWPPAGYPANYQNFPKRFPPQQNFDYNNNFNQGKLNYNNSFNFSANQTNPLNNSGSLTNPDNRANSYTLNPNNPTFKSQFLPTTTDNSQNLSSLDSNNLNSAGLFTNSIYQENLNPNNLIKEEKIKIEEFIPETKPELPKSGIPNIKEQFMSFVPGFFTQDAFNNTNNNQSNFSNMNFITSRDDTNNKSEDDKINNFTNQKENETNENLISQTNRNNYENLPTIKNTEKQNENNLIGNFKMIDFTNYFNQNKQEIPVEQENNENLENEENNQFEDDSNNENEYYQSEREKIIEDSGTEDRGDPIQFNFNSIFGQNNMKLINPSYNDFNTDTEEPKQNLDGNKPYFDKNLFFSFDSVFKNGNKTTSSFFNTNSSNLFSGTTKSSSLLSELRDEEPNENKNNEIENHNKLDDVAEIEDDDDDEEDPLWNTDNVDINKEGFFDATGNYKLKQMDFNFNLDFNSKK